MHKWSMRAVVLSLSLLILSPPAVSPAVADMIEAFPQVSPNIVMLVLTMPSIIMVIFSLVYSKLVRFTARRTLVNTAMICYIIGGVAPAFLDNIYMIILMRGIFGIGIGFLMPIATGIITDFYDGQDRATMMGWQSAAVNFGGLVFMFGGGLLAANNWQNTFYIYLIGLAIAIWVFLKLPEPQVAAQEKGIKIKLPLPVIYQVLGIFVFNMLFFTIMTNSSVMISNEGIGTTSEAGTVLTLFMIGGFGAGLVFGKTVNIFRRLTTAAGWLFTGAGLLIIGLSYSLIPIAAGAFFAGFGMATTMPSFLIKISTVAPVESVSVAFGFVAVAVGTGQFISPILFDLINRLFNQEIGRFPIFTSAILLIVGGIAIAAANLNRNNKGTNETAAT